VRRISWSTVGAFAAYACASCFYFGYPVVHHPGRDLIGTGVDVDLFTWMLGWWPHAILHWENPIVTHAIWAPQGVRSGHIWPLFLSISGFGATWEARFA
jgi:hypothetical protein